MAKRVNKLNLWLKHFTNDACSTTFLNKTESAKRAGYKCSTDESFRSVGAQNFTKLTDKINKWLDEEGLSENALKTKMLGLLNASETKLMKIRGAVDPKNLPENCVLVATAGLVKFDKQGEYFCEGDSLIAINMDAKETQRRTLDMAMKYKGMFKEDNKQQAPASFNFNVMPPEKDE